MISSFRVAASMKRLRPYATVVCTSLRLSPRLFISFSYFLCFTFHDFYLFFFFFSFFPFFSFFHVFFHVFFFFSCFFSLFSFFFLFSIVFFFFFFTFCIFFFNFNSLVFYFILLMHSLINLTKFHIPNIYKPIFSIFLFFNSSCKSQISVILFLFGSKLCGLSGIFGSCF